MNDYLARTVNLQLPSCQKNVDVLAFWKKTQHFFPHIAKLAREILSIQAASTASERMFKATGRVITKDRCNLDQAVVGDLVFIQQNLHLLTETHSTVLESQSEGPKVAPKPSSSSVSTVKSVSLQREFC